MFLILYFWSMISFFNQYVHESSTLINGTIPVCSYRTKTGIQIIIAKTNGPMIKTYFCLGKNLIVRQSMTPRSFGNTTKSVDWELQNMKM